MNILLGLTGSVATTLAPKLADKLRELGNVEIIVTEAAIPFLNVDFYTSITNAFYLETATNKFRLYKDVNEWSWNRKTQWGIVPSPKWQKDDEVLHIRLRDWADCFVIAPLSANTLSKIAHGLCDNLLTSVVRAWDWNKPFVVAPAMNTKMWDNPITKKCLRVIEEFGARIVPPIVKTLACGETGEGAMAKIDDIFTVLAELKHQ